MKVLRLSLSWIFISCSFLSIAQSGELQQLYARKYEAQQQNDLTTARIWGEKAVAQAELEFGKAGLFANYAFDLATLYVQLKEFDKAAALYRDCISIYEKEYGPQHEYCGTGWLNLGFVYDQQTKFPLAEESYLKALSIYTKSGNAAYLQQTEQVLTALYQKTDNYEKLIPWIEKSLLTFDPASENYAITLSNIGYYFSELKQFEKSKPYYEEALTILARLKGKEDPTYVQIANGFGIMCIENHDYAGAKSIFEQNLKYYEKQNGKQSYEYAYTLNNLALSQKELLNFPESEKIYNLTIDTYRKAGYADSLVFASAYLNMGGLYLDWGKFPEAQKCYQQSITLYKKNFGEEHPQCLTALHNLASVYVNQNEFGEAEKQYMAILIVKEKLYGKMHYEYGATLAGLGELYEKKGDYPKAEKYFIEAVAIYEKTYGKGSIEYAVLLTSLAYSYQLQGQFSKAEPMLTEALKTLEDREGKQGLTYASTTHTIGLLYDAMGLHQKAEPHLLEAERIRKQLLGESHNDYAIILNDLGLHYQRTGQFGKAGPLLENSLAIKQKLFGEIHSSCAVSVNNLAIFYSDKGEYGLSEVYFKKALHVYELTVGKKHPHYAIALANLGRLYFEFLQYTKAADVLGEAYSIEQEVLGPKHPTTLTTLNFIGLLYQQTGQYDEAEKYFNECLELRAEALGKNHPHYLDCLLNLGDVYRLRKNYKEAEKYYMEAIKSGERILGKENIVFVTYLNNLAMLYTDQKQYGRARPLLEEVYRIRKKLYAPSHPEYINIQSNLADVYTNLKLYDQAEVLYQSINRFRLEQIQKLFPYLSERERETFIQVAKSEFNVFRAYVYQRAKVKPQLLSELLNLQIASKGLLLTTLNEIRRAIYKSNDTVQIRRFEELKSKKELLAKVITISSEELRKQNIDQVALEKEVEVLEKQMNLGLTLASGNVSWQEIQKKLTDKEALVEIAQVIWNSHDDKDSTSYLALVVTSKANQYPAAVWLDNGADLDNRYFTYYKNAIKVQSEDLHSYKQFWQQIAESIPAGINRIYVSPDGVYNKINLNTLRNPLTKKYLLEETNIHLLANPKDVVVIDRTGKATLPTAKKRKAALFGFPYYDDYAGVTIAGYQKEDAFVKPKEDTTSRFLNLESITDLPGTKGEVESIQRVLADQGVSTSLYIRSEATEERLKMQRDFSILHIATHGFFMPDEAYRRSAAQRDDNFLIDTNPLLRSGLLLAGAKKAFEQDAKRNQLEQEDGILTAYEAMNLDLENTELVALSACETGVGDVQNGEGIFGLQRAFIAAGAQTLLMSLWKVDDEATRELMIAFYSNWMKVGNKHEAFQLAQSQLKEKFPQPYYWGAFVIIGR